VDKNIHQSNFTNGHPHAIEIYKNHNGILIMKKTRNSVWKYLQLPLYQPLQLFKKKRPRKSKRTDKLLTSKSQGI